MCSLLLLALLLVIPVISLRAQDIHFSQFFNAPYAQSPANIGQFDGQYRMGAIYRQQWRSVTVPYSTFGMGGDAAGLAGVEGLGLGAWIYNDRAGTSRLNTFHADLGASWAFALDADRTQHLVLGTQLGWSNMSIDYGALRFDAQYNGFSYDPSLGTGEQFPRTSRSRMDVHAGIGYRHTPGKRRNLTAGVALFNLTTPDVSLFEGEPSPLDLRPVVHLGGQFPVSEKVDLLPMAQWQAQGEFRELDLGAAVRYIMLDQWGLVRALQGGVFMRAKDAGYVYAGLEHDDWTFGISYDVNLSRLEPASRNRGGFEFTAIRVFRKRPAVPVRFKACPEQL
ncbi:MAG TPA: PorP/SprF family type IX secretion system membrane protein [Flavobacteriales bacterium]|nr:PorP/SprF family type IX secretion system membrane protein [Flavobacteriales bacterium]